MTKLLMININNLMKIHNLNNKIQTLIILKLHNITL